jgi:hypothetical protein
LSILAKPLPHGRTVGRNRFIAPPSLRVAQCASLIAPYTLRV